MAPTLASTSKPRLRAGVNPRRVSKSVFTNANANSQALPSPKATSESTAGADPPN